jgi:hypothetical protein
MEDGITYRAKIEKSCNLIFILNFNQTSLMKICVSQIYEKPHSSKIVFTLFNQGKFAFCVLCGFSYIWETQIFISEVWLKFNIKMRLHDQFQQTWRETLHNWISNIYDIYKNNKNKYR